MAVKFPLINNKYIAAGEGIRKITTESLVEDGLILYADYLENAREVINEIPLKITGFAQGYNGLYPASSGSVSFNSNSDAYVTFLEEFNKYKNTGLTLEFNGNILLSTIFSATVSSSIAMAAGIALYGYDISKLTESVGLRYIYPYVNSEGISTTRNSGVKYGKLIGDYHDYKIYNLAVTFGTDGTIKAYLCGELIHTIEPIDDFINYDTISAMTLLATGQAHTSLNTSDYFISSQRIYNRVLTKDEIISNYKYELSRLGVSTFRYESDGIKLEPKDTIDLQLIVEPETTHTLQNFTEKSTDESIATVTNNKVTAIGTGTTEITAETTIKSHDYKCSKDIEVESLTYDLQSVRTADDIVLVRYTSEIEVGEEYPCLAILTSQVTSERPYKYSPSDDNLVKFISSDESVCIVKNGVLKGIKEGTVMITVSDIDDVVSKTFTVNVVAETSLSYTDSEVLIVDKADYDFSSAQSTTEAFISILSDASSNGIKKVVFPKKKYKISPDYGTIEVPTNMIIDFSNSVIQIIKSALTTKGYTMFSFNDTEYSSIENAIIYGERYLIEGTGSEQCKAIQISGASYKSGLKNCIVSRSPGFNCVVTWTRNALAGFTLSSVEEGGIDNSGNDVDADYTYRCNGYIDISKITADKFGFGNMQGYQGYSYLSARLYNIYFYDSNKNFISSLEDCLQFYIYDKPSEVKYARISYVWGSAPTACDPDFLSIAHIYPFIAPTKCYIKNCIMEDNFSTAIAPIGGDALLIDNCMFKNNGYRDPASHIDWEDGWMNAHGHVIRNCTFKNGGTAITVVGASDLSIHNNVFYDTKLGAGADNRDCVQYLRIWLNQFIGSKATATIKAKTDEVFSQNYGSGGATYTLSTLTDGDYACREVGNSFN